MPSGERHDKQIRMHGQHRIEMLGLIAAASIDPNRVKVSSLELDLPYPTQTSQTVAELILRNSGVNFRFVFGADSYNSMPTWKNGKKMQRELPLLVISREGQSVELYDNADFLEVPIGDTVSSTIVRDRLRKGLSIGTLVCCGIDDYIRRHGLYRPEERVQ